MNRNLAIIGASYLQLPLIEKAKELGYTTHVFAWEAGDVGEAAADYFYPISIVEKDEILAKCREIGVCGVCSIASDLAAITVNYVAHALGLPCNSPAAVFKSTNKHAMRVAFAQNSDPSPRSVQVASAAEAAALQLSFPVIVKPTDRSGSRGIYKVERAEDLDAAIRGALESGFEKRVLIEEFAEGTEYSAECISFEGKHSFLALTLKYTTGAPRFIETGHMEPAPVDAQTLERVKTVVFHALDSLGITNGASHSELKIADDGEIKLIEIGGRMGGDCIGSDLVRLSTGYDFTRMVIDTACGIAPCFDKVCTPHPAACRFLFTVQDIQRLERLKAEHPERLVRVMNYQPENIGHITDSSNRAGCYLYLLDTTAEKEHGLP